jgi:hypothetical protein
MDRRPRRRWFAFRLRTLFVLVAVLSIPLAWAGYPLNWIRERRKFLYMKNEPFDMVDNVPPEMESFMVTFLYQDPDTYKYYDRPRAPGGLWLFGEEGYPKIEFLHASPELMERTRRLFPEATVENDSKRLR